MENKPATQKKLPDVGDLYSNQELVTKSTALAVLMNQQPSPNWIKEHPIVKVEVNDGNGGKKKVPLKYLPIEVIEFLLTSIFSAWKVEIKESKLIANSMVVTVRLHYLDPISGIWEWQDGIGASPIQTDSGAGATEFDKIKSAAVMMSAPAAETFAIKDAAEKLGKLFGKDLNRKDALAYDSLIEANNRRFKGVE